MADFPRRYKSDQDSKYCRLGQIFPALVRYTCEFCDIPSLYGRNPRLKTPEQVVASSTSLRTAMCFGLFRGDNSSEIEGGEDC